ncbi:MAG: MFS transporter [Desulfomonilaceae bacterium]
MIARLFGTQPADRIDQSDVSRGLRALLYEGVLSQAMDSFTGGALLVAFALLLGASNVVIGLLAAISPLTQLLQIPAIYLVDRIVSRKAVVVVSSFFSRIFWLVVAVIPWLVAPGQRLPVLLACLFFYFGLASVAACAFNPWMRDFVPEKIMGRYFGKRMALATAGGVVVAVLAGTGIEIGKWCSVGEFVPYSILFVLGGMAGLAGVLVQRRIPEPRAVLQRSQGVFERLGRPLRDLNFRRLLTFLGTWFFAINLAGPFYAVYMIEQLQLPMALVVGLSTLGQITSVVSFRGWGRAADRFSNKSVLYVSGYMYIFSVLLWPFLALSHGYFFTIPLLVVAQVLMGIASAGLNLCTANIALKAAPHGKATSFLALNTLVHGVTAAVAPILGGVIADRLTGKQLPIASHLPSAHTAYSYLLSFVPYGLHFIFVITGILCLCAMHLLRGVRENGETKVWVVVTHLATEAGKALRHVFTLAGPRRLHFLLLGRYREAGVKAQKGLERELIPANPRERAQTQPKA